MKLTFATAVDLVRRDVPRGSQFSLPGRFDRLEGLLVRIDAKLPN